MSSVCPTGIERTCDGAVIRSGSDLTIQLVWLWGMITNQEPPAVIAERCRDIAAAYEQLPPSSPLCDANRREIVQMLTQEADRFSRKANSQAEPVTLGGGGSLEAVS